jgi:DNA polymerase-3 subunit gamma/tau
MVLVRLAYVADLPSPAELVRSLDTRAPAAAAPSPARGVPAPAPSPVARVAGEPARAVAQPAPAPAAPPAPALPQPQSFLEVVELFDKHKEALLRSHLVNHAHLVWFEPGRIELRPTDAAPRDLSNRLGQLLTQWTCERWVVIVSSEPGEPTLRETADARARALRSEAAQHPLVRAVLDAFPGARIEAVRELAAEEPPPPSPESADEVPEGDEL